MSSFMKTQCLKRQSAAISSDEEEEKKQFEINKKRQSMAMRALESAYVEDVDDDIKLLEEMNAPTVSAPSKLLSNEQIDAMQKAVLQTAKTPAKKAEKEQPKEAVKNPYSLRRHPKMYNMCAALGKMKI